MKIFALALSLFLFSSSQANSFTTPISTVQQAEEELKEVNPKNLPEEVRFDITENYHGAKVLKSYKRFRDGEFVGYLVQIEQVKKEWTLKYDAKGNPENKITPQGI